MLFYRAKPNYDGMMIRQTGLTLIANELFIAREFEKLSKPDLKGFCIRAHWVEPVILPEKRVYSMMGARFEFGRNWNCKEVNG